MEAIGSLITVLEESQTQKDKAVAANLSQNLATVDVAISQQPELGQATLQRLVSVLCSWLRAHEEFPDDFCIRIMVKLLAKLVGRDQASDSIAIQKGVLSSTSDLLKRYPTDGVLIKYCLEIVVTLSVISSSDIILSRLEIVPLLLELLGHHPDNYSVIEDTVTTLALLAKRTRHRRSLKESRCVPALVDILKRGGIGRPSLAVAICRFFGNFAVKEDLCLMVLHHGGVDALMFTFDHAADVDTRSSIASALWVCSAESGEVQKCLLACGWMTSLAAILQANPRHAGLHESVLGIVRGLCRNPQYREDIVNLGFIDATRDGMRTFSDNTTLLKEACGVFGNLATDPRLRSQLGECGAIQEILKALSKCTSGDDRKVAKLALGALANLASCEANREIIANTDAVAILLGAARLFMTNENILEYAIGAISHIAVNATCNEQLIRAGSVEALLIFIEEHQEDLVVVSKSLVALRRLLRQAPRANHASVVRQIACAGQDFRRAHGIHLLVDALQAHIYDETAVKEAALLLTSLSDNPGHIAVMMKIALFPCMKALEVHQREFGVADALAALLARLPVEEEDACWAPNLGAGVVELGASNLLGGAKGMPECLALAAMRPVG